MYAALGYAGSLARHRGGILLSTDYGATFPTTITATPTGNTIHQGPVTDIEVDERNPEYLYAATFGHGFWFHDWSDGGVLPDCSP